MYELLDIYTEDGRHVGVADRNVAHEFALWHRTVHCWLVRGGNIIFQRRSSALNNNPGKLYTTASGHLQAGESLEDAFTRETREEFGVAVKNPVKILTGNFSLDFKRTDGSDFRDRAMYSIFFAETDVPLDQFKPQAAELDGLVEMDMKSALDLFDAKIDSLSAVGYLVGADGKFTLKDITITRDDFVCNKGETLEDKYGKVINSIISRGV